MDLASDSPDPAGTAPVTHSSSQTGTQPGPLGAPGPTSIPPTVTAASSAVPTPPTPAALRALPLSKSRQGTPQEQPQAVPAPSGIAAAPEAITATSAVVPSAGSAGANPVARSGNGGDAAASLAASAALTEHPQGALPQAHTPQNTAPQAGSPPAGTSPNGTLAAGGPQANAGATAAVAAPDPSQVPPISQAAVSAATEMAVQALTASVAATTPAPAAASPPPISLATLDAHAAHASQVAPALLSLATSPTGTQRMTLRLDPADLGTVQVRIDRPVEAPAHIEVTVSRPETLNLLVRDQAQLQHTLDQAGVPSEGRTLSFHLSSQDADSQSRQASGFDQSAGNDRSTRNGATPGRAAPDDSDPGNAASMPPPNPMRWQRAGLDITA